MYFDVHVHNVTVHPSKAINFVLFIVWRAIIITCSYRNGGTRLHRTPPKNAPPRRDILAPFHMWFPDITRSHTPNGTSIGSAVFAGLTIVTNIQTHKQTDRHTDRRRYKVCSKGCILCYARRCGLIIKCSFYSEKIKS